MRVRTKRAGDDDGGAADGANEGRGVVHQQQDRDRSEGQQEMGSVTERGAEGGWLGSPLRFSFTAMKWTKSIVQRK